MKAKLHYLEIITADTSSVCMAYSSTLGCTFSEPVAELGNARVADLIDQSLIGVRAPMSDSEGSLIRPYWLVNDIEAKLEEITKAGGEVAHPPLEIAGRGTFAIYILAGLQHGLWQLS